MMVTFSDPSLKRMYEHMLAAAQDQKHPSHSVLFHDGRPSRGGGLQAAFWDGYMGMTIGRGKNRSAHAIPGSFAAAALHAGREFAKIEKRAGKPRYDASYSALKSPA